MRLTFVECQACGALYAHAMAGDACRRCGSTQPAWHPWDPQAAEGVLASLDAALDALTTLVQDQGGAAWMADDGYLWPEVAAALMILARHGRGRRLYSTRP